MYTVHVHIRRVGRARTDKDHRVARRGRARPRRARSAAGARSRVRARRARAWQRARRPLRTSSQMLCVELMIGE